MIDDERKSEYLNTVSLLKLNRAEMPKSVCLSPMLEDPETRAGLLELLHGKDMKKRRVGGKPDHKADSGTIVQTASLLHIVRDLEARGWHPPAGYDPNAQRVEVDAVLMLDDLVLGFELKWQTGLGGLHAQLAAERAAPTSSPGLRKRHHRPIRGNTAIFTGCLPTSPHRVYKRLSVTKKGWMT